MSTQAERRARRAARKAAGVFYTPEYIVDYILQQTLANHDVVTNPVPKVLDPACGTGNFLIAAYDLLLHKFGEMLPLLRQYYADRKYMVHDGQTEVAIDGATYWCRENLHYHLVRHCLYGADIDAQAIAIAHGRLLDKCRERPLCQPVPNLLLGDSLIKWEDSNKIPADIPMDAGQQSRLGDFWSCGYDFIVGNPPYVSFGLNRVGKMTVVQSDYLRANYPRSAQYKLSYYALFLERSILALNPGGYLGFITPDSYLLGRYYSKIRQYILDTCRIHELTLAGSKVFSGVQVGIPVITVLSKGARRQQAHADVLAVNKLNDSGKVTVTHQYPQNYFDHQAYNRFRLFFNAKDKGIIDTIEQAPNRFGDLTKIRTGMRSLTVQAAIKSKNRQGDSWKQGVISSSQVLPFGIVYQGDWLDVTPAKLNKGGWDAAVIAGPKIFLRQTGDSLIAAVDNSGLYHLNNIHSLTVLDPGICLDYLSCILNSRLMNFYYHIVTLEKGRSMAQVDIETVEKLPLCIDRERAGLLAGLGRTLAQLVSRMCSLQCQQDNTTWLSDFTAVYHEMNQVVYHIYGLSADDVLYIEQHTDSYWERYKELKKPRGRQW